MVKTGILYVWFLLAIGSMLAGCKLAIVAVEGGDVESTSGLYSCLEGNNCIIEITSSDFKETFIAKPREGYEFSHWLAGDGLFCGDSADPRCIVNNTGLAGNEAWDPFIAADFLFYILPVFVKKTEDSSLGLSAALQTKFDNSCTQCHTTGRFGAPVIHDEAAWAPRLAKGMPALINSVKNGLGQMPSGGNCTNCSDEDYRDLITYMSGPSR